MFFEQLVNDPLSHKADLLTTVLPANITIIIAIASLTFVIYQLDKYKRFKDFNYLDLVLYVIFTGLVGLAHFFLPLLGLGLSTGGSSRGMAMKGTVSFVIPKENFQPVSSLYEK
jgi:hypothetical protein